MDFFRPKSFVAAASMAVVAAACAQPGATVAAANPLDARAAVPALTHTSALARYRPAGDSTILSWQEANDRVARIGGWRAYAREANQPEAAAAAPPAPPAAAASDSRSMPGHHGHGKP